MTGQILLQSSHSPRPCFSPIFCSLQPELGPPAPLSIGFVFAGTHLNSVPANFLTTTFCSKTPPPAPTPYTPFPQYQRCHSASNVPFLQTTHHLLHHRSRRSSRSLLSERPSNSSFHCACGLSGYLPILTRCFVAAYPCETACNSSTPTVIHIRLDLARLQVFRNTIRLLPLKSCPLEGEMQQNGCLFL